MEEKKPIKFAKDSIGSACSDQKKVHLCGTLA